MVNDLFGEWGGGVVTRKKKMRLLPLRSSSTVNSRSGHVCFKVRCVKKVVYS